MAYTWTAILWYDTVAPEDHESTGWARLIWQYRGDQPRIQAFLGAFLEQVQSLEDVTYDVLTGIWPLTAIGDQLDVLGEIVGQKRGELTDDQYRVFILGRIFVNHMNGTVPEFYELLDIFGITDIYYSESYPAYCRFDCSGTGFGMYLAELIFDGKPAGVDLLWIYNDELEADCFAMSDTAGSDEVNANGGFANIAGVVGGLFSGSRVQ